MNKVEKAFTDLIGDNVGPNLKREKLRGEQFETIKSIITTSLQKEFPTYIPHVLPYGSYPSKTYLEDGDIDITVLFEDINSHTLLTDIPSDVINKSIQSIEASFESHNNTEHTSNQFTNINIIYAEIQLLKCTLNKCSIDISINNGNGVAKILFMSFINKSLSFYLKNESIFKRTLLLIKAWAYYEGVLIGSSVGLIASYAVEVLVIYGFNNYAHGFTTEVEAFFMFFKIMSEFKWDEDIVHIFGTINKTTFSEGGSVMFSSLDNFEIEPFWYGDYDNIKDYPYAMTFNETQSYINKGSKLLFVGEKKRNFIFKNMNIIDPICGDNNLGKSLSVNTFNRINKIFHVMNKEIDVIVEIRNGNCPFLYMNALLGVFKRTISFNYVDQGMMTGEQPKGILIDRKDKGKGGCFSAEEIKKFNLLFGEQQEDVVDYQKYKIGITRDIYNYLLMLKDEIENILGRMCVSTTRNITKVEEFFRKFGLV